MGQKMRRWEGRKEKDPGDPNHGKRLGWRLLCLVGGLSVCTETELHQFLCNMNMGDKFSWAAPQ